MSGTATDPVAGTSAPTSSSGQAHPADPPSEDGAARPPADDPQGPGAPSPREPLSWPARALALVGWGVAAVGALGALDRISHFAFPIPWADLAWWFAYSALFHDLLIAPVVTLVALAVGRGLPRPIRAPVAVGLIVSGSLVVMSYPRLRGYGAIPGDPSILPGNAARDLALVLGLVWVAVAAWLVARAVRARRP